MVGEADMASARRSRVQRARPSGGLEQAVATSRASSLPVGLRSAPGARLLAQRQLQVAEYKAALGAIDGRAPTPMLIAISSSLAPASAASKICARFILRAAW
jgi:hypothetical protein